MPLLLLWVCCCAAPLLAQSRIHGTVRDAATGRPLPLATIQVKDTFAGTIANDDGDYELALDDLPATLVITYIGYQSREVPVAAPQALDIDLTTAPVILAATLVSGEDPAVGIMRQVLARKKVRARKLRAYRADAYARWHVAGDSALVGIMEFSARIFWDAGRGMREKLTGRRASANLAADGDFDAFGSSDLFVDLYADEIRVADKPVIAPTHPEALRHYRFALVGQRRLDDRLVHDIAVAPRSQLQSALVGTLAVLDGEFALLEANLSPNAAATAIPSPALRRFDLSYRQQFRAFDGLFLPVDLRLEAFLKIGMPGLRMPAMRQWAVLRLSDYRINPQLPDSLFAGESRVDTLAARRDSLLADAPVPLTAAERRAYAEIDSNRSYDEIFKPTGFLAGLIPDKEGPSAGFWPDLKKQAAAEAWYDRVDAAFLGARTRPRLDDRLRLDLHLGYSTGQQRWAGEVGLRYKGPQDLVLSAGYRRGSHTTYSSPHYSRTYNSIGVFTEGMDYFDYFWRRGPYARLDWRRDRFALRAGLLGERHASLAKSDRLDVFGRFDQARPNPPAAVGRLRALSLSASVGDPPDPLFARRRAEIAVEFSGPRSDFSYGLYRLSLDWHGATFFRRRLAPNVLAVRLLAGASSGNAPPQRLFALDAGYQGFASFGTLHTLANRPYAGDRHLGFFWEHNFKTVPFELLGLRRLARLGTGLMLHGAAARTWADAPGLAPAAFHREAGLALVLFHGWKLSFTRRLDRPDWRVTLGAVRIDYDIGQGD